MNSKGHYKPPRCGYHWSGLNGRVWFCTMDKGHFGPHRALTGDGKELSRDSSTRHTELPLDEPHYPRDK